MAAGTAPAHKNTAALKRKLKALKMVFLLLADVQCVHRKNRPDIRAHSCRSREEIESTAFVLVSSAITFGPAFASAVETVLVKWKTWKRKPYEAPARIDFRRSIPSKRPRLLAHANTDFCIGLNHRDLNGVELQTMDPIRIAKNCVATIPEGGSGEISVLSVSIAQV
jgi:hypothetical protein